MKKHLISFLAVICIVHTGTASSINFQSGTVNTFLQSDGSTSMSALANGTYQFALGTFSEASLSGDISTWYTSFTDQMVGTNGWRTTGLAPLQNKFQNDVQMSNPSSTGQQAYIFGYNPDQSEIIIFRNADWTFPAFDALNSNVSIFSLQDANTEIVTAAGSWINYSNNITMLSAVPEPSAYAAIAGFLALGGVMVRRRC